MLQMSYSISRSFSTTPTKTPIATAIFSLTVSLTALLISTPAFAAPELKSSVDRAMVGEEIQITASSGSSLIPVYAKDWNVSSEFGLISSNRSGAKIKAIKPGFGTVSAKVNLRELAIDIRVVAAPPIEPPAEQAKPAAIEPVIPSKVEAPIPLEVPVAAMTPAMPEMHIAVPVVTAAPASKKLTACQQEIVDRKREIAHDFNEGHYTEARNKLLELKKSWQDDSRWADALLGAIDKLAPNAEQAK
jgi:hypothetical protein